MNDAPIQIRNPKVVRAIRALASETGRPISEALDEVVLAELARRHVSQDETVEARRAAIRDIVRQIRGPADSGTASVRPTPHRR